MRVLCVAVALLFLLPACRTTAPTGAPPGDAGAPIPTQRKSCSLLASRPGVADAIGTFRFDDALLHLHE